ncbi:MAG: DUF167 domain-containing protein [Dehalococcoidia bacterium]|nr:DUF167 domain-containing protein [Dehalococcoidia bacterium]
MKVRIRVRPNSRTEEVTREGDGFMVNVKEPPHEGRANRAVIKLLAGHFGVPQSRVTILSGLRSRDKVVEITDQ